MTKSKHEIEGKRKQLIRLLISFNDFKNAYDIANLIIEENYQERVENSDSEESQKNKRIWESLNSAMVIGYNRPISSNDKTNKNPIPDLPNGVFKVLNEHEKSIHQSLIDYRNKLIAHSDSEAIDMELYYMKIGETNLKILVPLQNHTRAPFLIDIVKIIKGMCKKLMEEIFKRRNILEKELENQIPIKQFGEDKFDFPFNLGN